MKIVDATNMVMGRLASKVAKDLLSGEEIVIVNAEKAIITGNKDYIVDKYSLLREIGTPRKGPRYPRMPDRILKRTVRGMLPVKKPSGKNAYERLKVYIGVPREYAGKNFEVYEDAKNKKLKGFITLKELSKHLGAN